MLLDLLVVDVVCVRHGFEVGLRSARGAPPFGQLVDVVALRPEVPRGRKGVLGLGGHGFQTL